MDSLQEIVVDIEWDGVVEEYPDGYDEDMDYDCDPSFDYYDGVLESEFMFS